MGHDLVLQPELGYLDGRLPSLIHWGCVPATRSGTATAVGSQSGGRRRSSDSSNCHLPPRGFFSREGTGERGRRASAASSQPPPPPCPRAKSGSVRPVSRLRLIDPKTGWLLTFRLCMYSVPIYQALWRDPSSRTPRFGRIHAPNFGFVTSFRAPKCGGPPQRNAVKMGMSLPHFGAG